jgi:tetratricopeptide (TPR) repeat protein
VPTDTRAPSLQVARERVQSHPASAIEIANTLLSQDGRDIDALEVLALASQSLGRHEEAECGFRSILALDPDARWARDDLARLLLANDRKQEAENVIREALLRDDKHADAHALLGLLLAEREALVEAGHHIERALVLAGRHPDLLVNLGRTALRRGDPASAIRLGREALGLASGHLAAIILVADAAEQSGDRAEALRWLDRAAPIAAAAGQDVDLARATVLAGGPDWRKALAQLDATVGISGHALLLRGRLRERAARPEDAWSDFIAGKAALARPYDHPAVEAEFSRFAAAFPSGLPAASIRRDVPQPIFILGAPRSGTTMTEQLLASHGEIRAGGELPFVSEMADLTATLLGKANFPDNIATLRMADHHHLPALLRDAYLARAEVYGLTAPGARFFTDKMPLNETWLPLIRVAFPRAPLIVVHRHPLDILVSAMGHDMTHGANAFYAPTDAARHLAATGKLLRHYKNALGIAPYRFGYEAFITDPAGETSRLMAHIGLAPEPAQAQFHALARHAPTPSYAQVREPLHDRSIGRWKAYASHLAPVRHLLADLMDDYGYEA